MIVPNGGVEFPHPRAPLAKRSLPQAWISQVEAITNA
jgi:hypothetical protein